MKIHRDQYQSAVNAVYAEAYDHALANGMARKGSAATAKSQTGKDDFKSVAKALGCDDDKATFDAKLGKLAKAKPDPKAPR